MANEYLLATEAGLQAMPLYTFPFIVFHGADDTLTDPDGSRTLYEKSQVRRHVVLLSPSYLAILLYQCCSEGGAPEYLALTKECVVLWQAKDKTFKLIKDRWHVLLKEPGNEEILQEVIAWLKARI